MLELLDGYECPAGACLGAGRAALLWVKLPACLARPTLFTGRIGWGRLTPPQTANGRLATPVRSSPISLFQRENHPLGTARREHEICRRFSA